MCVYGGTASGVMAAVAAADGGASVLLVEPSRWLGGMTGGGISAVDWGRKESVGGGTRRFLETHSGSAAYRRGFAKLVDREDVRVLYDHRLAAENPVRKDGAVLRAVVLDLAPVDATGCPIPAPLRPAAATVEAKVFLDCSYEGDLMAAAGVSYTYGRESRERYGESLAGVRPSLWIYDIDPHVTPGRPDSGLLPLLQDFEIGPLGAADRLTMGYCLRYKFGDGKSGDGKSGDGKPGDGKPGDGKAGDWPIGAPADYDPAEFELFRRGFRKGLNLTRGRKISSPGRVEEYSGTLFRQKDGNINRALLTTTVFGCNAVYPDGDWADRAAVWKFHQEFLRRLVRFVETDPAVPADLKREAASLTFRRGEFDDTRGWPSQLYVREARRMVSEYVVSQHDMAGETAPERSVGLASYGVDDWPYATVAENGKVALQGGGLSKLYLDGGRTRGIYEIPYEAIVPRKAECENLLVPVCCSASHIAMTSIRMEPTWMLLGESAGAAAALAVADGTAVQDVPHADLEPKLRALGQKLGVADALPGRRDSWDAAAWNREKPGYEWVFPRIDADGNGTVSAAEYAAFQAFKRRHADWEPALRQAGQMPAGVTE